MGVWEGRKGRGVEGCAGAEQEGDLVEESESPRESHERSKIWADDHGVAGMIYTLTRFWGGYRWISSRNWELIDCHSRLHMLRSISFTSNQFDSSRRESRIAMEVVVHWDIQDRTSILTRLRFVLASIAVFHLYVNRIVLSGLRVWRNGWTILTLNRPTNITEHTLRHNQRHHIL